MDLRTRRTQNNIVQAFMELRTRKDIERMTVKELSDKACINKATFYRHFEDLYALSDQVENDLIQACIDSIPADADLLDRKGLLALTASFVKQSDRMGIVFSGSRADACVQKLRKHLMARIFLLHPEYEGDLEKEILISCIIYGVIHASRTYEKTDFDFFINTILKLNDSLHELL